MARVFEPAKTLWQAPSTFAPREEPNNGQRIFRTRYYADLPYHNYFPSRNSPKGASWRLWDGVHLLRKVVTGRSEGMIFLFVMTN